MIESFRNEIIEAQRGRLDLFKWKLIISATLGAVGLGVFANAPIKFAPSSQVDSFDVFATHMPLCLIPLACAYIDLICVNLQLRMLVIGGFFVQVDGPSSSDDMEIPLLKQYEFFCSRNRRSFCLDDWAQFASSILFSFLVLLVGLNHPSPEDPARILLITFSIFGFACTSVIYCAYHKLEPKLLEHVRAYILAKKYKY